MLIDKNLTYWHLARNLCFTYVNGVLPFFMFPDVWFKVYTKYGIKTSWPYDLCIRRIATVPLQCSITISPSVHSLLEKVIEGIINGVLIDWDVKKVLNVFFLIFQLSIVSCNQLNSDTFTWFYYPLKFMLNLCYLTFPGKKQRNAPSPQIMLW